MFRRSTLLCSSLGFIGLGQMGARMVPHALKNTAAYPDGVIVYDANPESFPLLLDSTVLKELDPATAKKLRVAKTPAEVAQSANHIVTMLPSGPIVQQVYRNDVFPHLKPGAICVDCSTTDPGTPETLAKELTAKDPTATFSDAPVSGGVVGAEKGTLTFMIGAANETLFSKVQGVLQPFGKAFFFTGEIGSGQICKLCNNLILGQHMVAVAEAMLIARHHNVDPQVLVDVVKKSTGKCWSLEVNNPEPGVIPEAPSSRGYAGGFSSNLLLKDMKLAMDAAKNKNFPTPGAERTVELYNQVVKTADWGTKDFGIVLKYIESMKD